MSKANLFVEKVLTGHMYYNSPYETYDSCGNCDGAKCEYCKERWTVEEFDGLELIPGGTKGLFETKEEAEAWAENLLKEKNVEGRVA